MRPKRELALKRISLYLVLIFLSLYVFISIRRIENSHVKTNTPAIPKPTPLLHTTQDNDGYTKLVWEQSSVSCTPSVAILSIVNDVNSWGEGGRTFLDFVDLISTIEFPRPCTSLNLLVSSREEFNVVSKAIDSARISPQSILFKYRKISLIHRDASQVSSRSDRKDPNIQKLRRRLLASLRNQLLYSVLETTHDYILWIDSDIIKIPPQTLQKMIDSGKDIIAARCNKKGTEYDTNSWAGPRLYPTESEWDTINQGGLFIPKPTDQTVFMRMWTDRTQPFMPLDSVGGTFLLVKADIHRSGIAFSLTYLIGAGWERLEGYDGIETEGLCYVAIGAGYKCWGMPFEIVDHSRN